MEAIGYSVVNVATLMSYKLQRMVRVVNSDNITIVTNNGTGFVGDAENFIVFYCRWLQMAIW